MKTSKERTQLFEQISRSDGWMSVGGELGGEGCLWERGGGNERGMGRGERKWDRMCGYGKEMRVHMRGMASSVCTLVCIAHVS